MNNSDAESQNSNNELNNQGNTDNLDASQSSEAIENTQTQEAETSTETQETAQTTNATNQETANTEAEASEENKKAEHSESKKEDDNLERNNYFDAFFEAREETESVAAYEEIDETEENSIAPDLPPLVRSERVKPIPEDTLKAAKAKTIKVTDNTNKENVAAGSTIEGDFEKQIEIAENTKLDNTREKGNEQTLSEANAFWDQEFERREATNEEDFEFNEEVENEERVAVAEFVGVENRANPGEEIPLVMSSLAAEADIDTSVPNVVIVGNNAQELQRSETESTITRISSSDTFADVQADTNIFVSQDEISVVAEEESLDDVESLSSSMIEEIDINDMNLQETSQDAAIAAAPTSIDSVSSDESEEVAVAAALTSADSVSSGQSKEAEVVDVKMPAKEDKPLANSDSEIYEPSVARNNYFDNYFEADSQREAAEAADLEATAAAAALTRPGSVSSAETEEAEVIDVKMPAKEDKTLAEEISEKNEASLARNNYFDDFFENQNNENSNAASNTNSTNASNETEATNTSSITNGFDMSRFSVAQNADKKSSSNNKKPAKNQNNNQQKKRGWKR